MKVAFTMRDDQGVMGVFLAEGEWIALDIEHEKYMKYFEPKHLHRIEISYANGSCYLYPYLGRPA